MASKQLDVWTRLQQALQPQQSEALMTPMAQAVDMPAALANQKMLSEMPVSQMAARVPNSVTQPTGEATSYKVSQSYLSPEAEARRFELQGIVDKFQQDRMSAEQAGIDDYQQAANQYQATPLQYDLTPLAGLLDQWSGGGNLMKVAQSMKGQTPAEKHKELMAMKQQLQGMKGNLTKSQFDMYKSKLDELNDERKTIAAEARYNKRLDDSLARQDRLNRRDNDKDLQAYERAVRDKRGVQQAIAPIETGLGFNLDDYDEISASVNGMQVDAPGVKIPGLKAAYSLTPEGERFRSKLASLLNQVMKSYGGTAVTESESARLLEQFAANPGTVRQSSFVAALKDYKNLLQQEINARGAGFRPEIVEQYESNLNLQKIKRPATNVSKGGAKPLEQMTNEELKQYIQSNGG